MPHIAVKVRAGYSQRQKARLSVGIEDVRPTDWIERVYEPDILRKQNTIYKQPGYAAHASSRPHDRAAQHFRTNTSKENRYIHV
jgi:phenylpyruvate tautomerase PptA (4-oxalocrotonate tautomerase family)